MPRGRPEQYERRSIGAETLSVRPGSPGKTILPPGALEEPLSPLVGPLSPLVGPPPRPLPTAGEGIFPLSVFVGPLTAYRAALSCFDETPGESILPLSDLEEAREVSR